MRSNRLLTILLVVFVALLGFSLILPLLPYYAEQYGANDLTDRQLMLSPAIAEEIGGTLGISASIARLTRVNSPVLGGLLLQWARPWGPALFAAVVMSYVANFVWRRLFIKPGPPLEPRAMSRGMPVSAG